MNKPEETSLCTFLIGNTFYQNYSPYENSGKSFQEIDVAVEFFIKFFKRNFKNNILLICIVLWQKGK